MSDYQIEALANAHCECGENPYWDAQRRRVLWTDIPNGRLFRLDVDSGAWEQFYSGELVGGFTQQADGRLLLFRNHNIGLLGDDGIIEMLAENILPETGRFNDVMADPEGRIFAGTMGTKENELAGGLYRIELDGTITHLWSGTGCSNGMGFSPDQKYFYWTDSTAKIISICDYDRTTGEVSNRCVWKRFRDEDGTPDGMTVDSDGCIWSAFWGGHAVRRFAPDGTLLDEIKFPVERVSSCTFGGDDRKVLFVTTAGGQDGADTPDGTLYCVRTDTLGQPEFPSRIGL